MQDPPVILEPYAFSSLMMSAIEVHDRESMGLLIGHKDRQFVQGKVEKCIAIQASYPIQTADRKRSTVGYGNFAARKRIDGTLNAVGFKIVGGYHSHPNAGTSLSEDDISFIKNEFEEGYSKTGLDSWLEVVIGVRRLKRPERSKYLKQLYFNGRVPDPGFHPWNTTPEIGGDLIIDSGKVYRVEMKGYWLEEKAINDALLCYSRY